MQDKMPVHEFVIQTVAPSGREIFEKKLSRMIEWVDPKYDWVHGPRSVVGLYTAKVFMKECLEPLGDTALTCVVMNALSLYFKKGVVAVPVSCVTGCVTGCVRVRVCVSWACEVVCFARRVHFWR